MTETPTIEPGMFYEGRGTHYAFVAPLDAKTFVGLGMTTHGRESIEQATLREAQDWLDRISTPDMVWESKKADLTAIPRTSEGRVYFIADEDGYIKIGHAQDPRKRLASLQTGHRQRLTLLATIPGGEPKEAELHRQFASSRVRGEWFAPTPAITALIESAA